MKEWILLAICWLPLAAASTILLPQQNVLHKSSGLIMKYISEYKPANDVIAITISIPVVTDMCYIVPWKAMIKIPQCVTMAGLDKNERSPRSDDRLKQKGEKNTPHKQNKRFIMEIISIAIGTAVTALSTTNTIQMNNLQKEIKTIQSSIYSLKNSINVYNSQLFQLTKGQIKIIEELHHT